jgi:hypothetical protein
MRVRQGSWRRHPPVQRSVIAFMGGVWMLHSMVWMPASARAVSKAGGEVGAVAADHERDQVSLLAEVHEEVAGLLGSPLPGGMQGAAGDADAPGRALDYGQHVGLRAVEQVGPEEVAGQDRLGLGAQELRSVRPAPPGGRFRWP